MNWKPIEEYVLIDLSVFSDFPKFEFAGEICVPILEYKGIAVKEGMSAIFMPDVPPNNFTILAIRLNPTLRFWDGNYWVLACSCKLIIES